MRISTAVIIVLLDNDSNHFG